MLQRSNNFDLIRLLAAVQVFVMHSVAWLKLPIAPLFAEVMDWFPGVPIFFMISGYLVTNSFVRLTSISEYFRNRVLRIFPGLWTCLVISYLLVAWRGELDPANLFLKTAFWFVTQGTVFQFVDFYVNPGVTNGVLWSVATEIQFYLLIPIICMIGSRFVLDRRWATIFLGALVLLSGAIHEWVLIRQTELLPRWFPTLYASILANGYLFIFGVMSYIWKDKLLPLVSLRAALFIVAYVTLRVALLACGISAHDVHSSMLGVLVYLALGGVVFSLAYSFVGISHTLLRGHDLSYGLYIYHMPIIYFLIYMGCISDARCFLLATSITFLMAAASWFLVERPCLRFKAESNLN